MKESEIWYLFNALVRASSQLHEMKMPHGDIQPKTVHLTKDGQVHLHNHHFLSAGQNGYYKMLTTPGYKAALSPGLLEQLKYKKMNPNHDPKASDLWSIGITTLCACTNNEYDRYYDWSGHLIRYDRIKKDFDRMKVIGYKNDLIDLLDEILEETEPRRIKFHEVEAFLDQIEEERSVMSALSRNSSLRGSMFNEEGTKQSYVYEKPEEVAPPPPRNPLMANYGGGEPIIRQDPLNQPYIYQEVVSPPVENLDVPIPKNPGFVTPPAHQIRDLTPPYINEATPPENYQYEEHQNYPPYYNNYQNHNPAEQYYENYENQPEFPQQQNYNQYQNIQPVHYQPQPQPNPMTFNYQSAPQLQVPSNNGSGSKYPYISQSNSRIGNNHQYVSRPSFSRRMEKYERDPTLVSTQNMISPRGNPMRRSVYTSVGRTIVEEEY